MRFFAQPSRTLSVALLLVFLSPFALAATPVVAASSELRLPGPVDGLDSLDPALSRDLSTNSVLRQVFRGLIAFDDALRPVPELAREITVSGDGLVYDVALRDTAVFHDGSAIEAEDVVFSLSRAVSPATADGDIGRLGGLTFLSGIRGFEDVVAGRATSLGGLTVVDSSHLRIELDEPQSTFLMRLAAVPASIVDKDQVESDSDWSSRPNGSGPYRVDRWTPDDELVLAAHDGYVTGPPETPVVTYRLGINALQPFNLFQAGEIDIDSVSPLDAPAVVAQQDDLDADLVRTDAFSLTYIAFRTDQPPLDDIHIRRALRLAFPREMVARVALEGEVAIAEGLIPNGMLGRAWSATLPAYDLDAAREEIRRSRFGTPEAVPAIRLDVAGSYGAAAFQDAIETDLGIEVEIVDHDATTFYDGLARGAYPGHELTWGADYPDPATFLRSLFHGESADNYVGYANPEVHRLLDEAERTSDPEARAPLYAEAQQLIVDDAVVIPLFHDVQHTLVRRGVAGLTVTSMGILRLETVAVDR